MYDHINNYVIFNINHLCAYVGDEDYETQNYSPIFYPGETRQRLLLDLIDDDTVEDTEYYFLNISSSLPERVSIARYAATKITIIDDDGKLYLLFLLYTYCFSIVWMGL